MIDPPLLTHEHNEKHAHEDSSGKNHDGESHEVGVFHPAAEDHGDQGDSVFTASYQFTCTHPHKLKSLEVSLFIEFPSIEKLETQILTSSGQTGANLTAQNNWVNL